MARAAREFALGYDADLVAEAYWKPVLEMLEQYAGAARVKTPRPDRVTLPVAQADGLKWLARGSHTDDWISVGHEDALAPALDSLMPEDGVLLDVGAHVGRWSLRLAQKASRVIAVEPNPDTAAVLRYHIALNEVTNVEVVEVAAWDKPERMTLFDPNDRVTGGSTRVLEADDGTVEALPLDAVLEDLDRLDLVKLDVEGADLHALAGMAGLLKRLRPVLFIEDHSIYGYYDHDALIAELDRQGYVGRPFTAQLAGDRAAPYVIARPLPEEQE
jgi:FkbM family methyltransferase